MAKILLLANLNCDRVLNLAQPLQTGGRHHYQDQGRRLGGGGANTGLSLVFAGHHVALVSQVGNDKTADWLLAEASLQGLDCHLLQRNELDTPELLLLMTPDGDRTIIRPQRPVFTLGPAPDFNHWQALYINSSAQGAAHWSQAALKTSLVVGQLPKDERQLPCHILITSVTDIAGRYPLTADPGQAIWHYAQHIAGLALRYVIVTDGANGATAYHNDGSAIAIAAVPTTVVDTTGAGDAFAAGLIDGLLNQQDITTAMQRGAQWAAIAVATVSSVPGQALQQWLQQQP